MISARIEEKLDGLTDTMERIEESITTAQDNMRADIDGNTHRLTSMWTVYRVGKWTIPTMAAVFGALAAAGLL